MITHLIFLLLSGVGTALPYLLRDKPLGYGWIPLLFLGCFVALQLLQALTIPFLSLFLSKEQKPARPKAWVNAYIRMMMRWLMPLCNVRVVLKGREKMPKEACVLVSNHRSMFDPMVILQAFPEREIVFVSKIENFRIPIAKKFFAHAGYLPIDRENAMKAMREIRRGIGMMQESHVDIGIYPEGTRSKTGELLEFKAGAFLLAKKANAPVVIISTKNTGRIAKRMPFLHTRVELEVLEVLDVETVQVLSMDEISLRVRSDIEESLRKSSDVR